MRYVCLAILFGLCPLSGAAQAAAPHLRGPVAAAAAADQAVAAAGQAARPVYLVYYWRARPGKTGEYSDYVRKVAEPIDEDARKAGVFEEVHTYTPAIVSGAPGADWTHMRVFRLKGYAALDAFPQGMDEATRRAIPDAAKRAENSRRSSELRDLVRQEIWYDFR
jgi:hypothetical protein